MKKTWLSGLERDAVIELKANYVASKLTRDKLKVICLGKLRVVDSSSHSRDGYDCPNWAYKQADTQGYKRALHEIMNLIE